ncbi:hypothetical protein HELRODRAFT_109344, partial [Helobdella robusta]|uniref:BRCT domain-containing protein n=1 Tax=Helobdella robusta TaxID=6412 RepID=T1EES6_HELRO
MEINCVWITENDCTKVENLEKRVYYVFEEFSGNGFNHLKNLGCKLYGPTCILVCSQRSQPLSQVSTPVFCFAMEGVVLSCTNLQKERRLEIYEKVKWMSGVTMAVVDEHITHLVAGEVGSKKYIVANTLKAAVMLPEWVDEVWNSSQTRIVHANDKEFENMKCPMFKGLSVCVSGLEHAERLKIKSLVEMHGGKCSGSLMIKECTHLIIKEPKGQKYQAAVKCNIRTVSPQWLDDCLTAGYCIEEDMYLIQPQMKSNDDDDGDGRRTGSKNTSTPTNQSRLADCNVTTLANISSISVSHVNDTFLSSTTKHNSTIDINMECNNSYTTSKEQDLQNFDKIFSSISSKNFKCNNFLDGCKIYFSGIPTSYMEKMKLISNKGSATRFDDLNDCVSHVVVHDVDHHLIRNLKQI